MTPRLDVELFETYPISSGTVLLRLEGRWHAEAREPLPMPTLVVDDGKRSQRLAALPGPDAVPPQAGPDPDLWRASYPAPAALLDDARIVFALDAGRGIIVDLPTPAPHGRGRRVSRSSSAELAHERTLRAQAERLADERRRALRDAEAQLDRERAARAAETLRADTTESDLGRIQAELESQRDHARADAAQRLRDAESAAGALAVAQARVRELDEALAAQRRRALEAESAARSTSSEIDAQIDRERERAADALAAQRALAEEATRAQIAAQTQAREHAARAVDLEIARDELRVQLERERELLRVLQAKEISEETIEERRRSRDEQARAETAENRLRQVTTELVTLAEERAHLQAELIEARERIATLEEDVLEAATVAPVPAPAAEPAAAPEPEPVVMPEPAIAPPAGPALLSIDQPTVAFSLPPEEDDEPSHAVAVFGPFGDAGPTVAPDPVASEPEAAPPELEPAAPEPEAVAPESEPPADPDPYRLPAADWLDRHIPERPTSSADDVPRFEPHPPPRWDADDFDLSFELPPQQTAAGRRAARQRDGQAAMVPVEGDAPRRRGHRRGREVEPHATGVATRQAVLLGIVLAALLLVALKVSGVIGALTLASL